MLLGMIMLYTTVITTDYQTLCSLDLDWGGGGGLIFSDGEGGGGGKGVFNYFQFHSYIP